LRKAASQGIASAYSAPADEESSPYLSGQASSRRSLRRLTAIVLVDEHDDEPFHRGAGLALDPPKVRPPSAPSGMAAGATAAAT
jgi:hypothetical protein